MPSRNSAEARRARGYRPSRPASTSVNATTGARDHASSVKNFSTVSSGGGKRRVTTYQGTTLSSPTSLKKAPAAARRTRARGEKVQAALKRVSKAYASQGGSLAGDDGKFNPDEAAALVRRVGGTKQEARALSTKVTGESGGDPKAIGDDAAAGYGNTYGLGLWQMTTGVGNDDLIEKHGGRKAMLKPKPNARAALELYRGGGIDNWYAPSTAPGDPSKVRTEKVKPEKRDLGRLRKAGIDPTALKERAAKSAKKKPFKRAVAASKAPNAAKIINPKWDPDDDGHGQTFLAKGISPVVKRWSKKYGVRVGEAKADSGHVSPGHLSTGTATDLYPKKDTERGWDRLEKGLKVLEESGMEVGYGSNGVGQAWSNHGRGNHAHVEWVGQGSAPDAILNLGGVTKAQLRVMERAAAGGGSVGGGATGGAIAALSGLTGASKGTLRTLAKRDPKAFRAALKEALARVRAAYAEDGDSASELTREVKA